MKTIKIMGLLALVLLCSCKQTGKNHNPTSQYYFFMSVQDKQGTDRIKGIDEDTDVVSNDRSWKIINSELYKFDVIYPVPCMDPRPTSPEFQNSLHGTDLTVAILQFSLKLVPGYMVFVSFIIPQILPTASLLL